MNKVFIIDNPKSSEKTTKQLFRSHCQSVQLRGYYPIDPYSLGLYNDMKRTELYLFHHCKAIALFSKAAELKDKYFKKCLKKGLKSGLNLISIR